MAFISVTGKILDPSGTVPASGTITATLNGYLIDNPEENLIVAKAETAVVSAVDGTFSISLESTLDGTPNTRTYEFVFTGIIENVAVTQSFGPFALAPSPASVTLADLIQAGLVQATAVYPLISGADAFLTRQETDQVLPLGLWRERISGDVWSLEKNTAAAGDFSTKTTLYTFTASLFALGTDISVGATKRIYLDGGGNTYITEDSADRFAVVAGGVTVLQVDNGGTVTLAGQIKNVNGAAAGPAIVGNNFATTGLFWAAGPVLAVAVSGAEVARFAGTSLFINDTSNANMTSGLTINQLSADNEILTLKSSDVAHGMTSLAETDTWMACSKQSPTDGGADIYGYSGATSGIRLVGRGVNDNTGKTTGAVGYVDIITQKKSGTSVAAPGADANLVTIGSSTTTRFIFDNEGSAHADVEFVAFDSIDDVAALNALQASFMERKPDAVRSEFGKFAREHREFLQREGIVNFYDDGPRGMVNFTKLAMLHNGAIRQIALKLERYEKALIKSGIDPKLFIA